MCCSVLQFVAAWFSAVQCGAVRCSAVQCVAVYCSVSQCIVVTTPDIYIEGAATHGSEEVCCSEIQ